MFCLSAQLTIFFSVCMLQETQQKTFNFVKSSEGKLSLGPPVYHSTI